MQLKIHQVVRPLEYPFSITGYTFENLDAIWVELNHQGSTGRGEGIGAYYLGDTREKLTAQLEAIRDKIEAGITREEARELLPAGGALNALDCALWDLECKQSGETIWQKLNIEPKNLKTVATIGMGTDEFMAKRARDFASCDNIKIKLDAERPLERVQLIRNERPDANLVIDANQAWTREMLDELLPGLAKLDVKLVEQPLRRGDDENLRGLKSPIPIGADESCLTMEEYRRFGELYDVINIKLDKCGGLTSALELAQAALADGKKLMVGNMTGSSLSMAPAFVIGQFCEFVDIDGPLLLAQDIENGLEYLDGGVVTPPVSALWG